MSSPARTFEYACDNPDPPEIIGARDDPRDDPREEVVFVKKFAVVTVLRYTRMVLDRYVVPR